MDATKIAVNWLASSRSGAAVVTAKHPLSVRSSSQYPVSSASSSAVLSFAMKSALDFERHDAR
jgi:hypothetical protein